MIPKSKKSKARAIWRKDLNCGSAPPVHPGVDGAQVENVQHFLRALNQISLALSALGYSQEGEALAQVKIDLNQKIFGLPERPAGAVNDLH